MMKTILVVDDEPCIRDLFVEFLSMAGHKVDARASGEEALEAVSRSSYDLLILDLCMKGMNGLTTLARVRSISPDAKALVVSGALDRFEAELEDARSNGVMGVLPKPFDLGTLSKLIETALPEPRQAA